MGKGKDEELKLPSLDDLFSSQKTRDEAGSSKIIDIPITEIDDFPGHPFKVVDDADMLELCESIKGRGVLTPAAVRKKEDGRYEMIAGHRRKRASALAGMETLRCEVVEIDLDAATIMMVDSNLQRTTILPSEKAFSYKMRLEAMKRQGQRSDLTSVPLAQKLNRKTSRQLLGERVGESQDNVRRYIRLTELIPEILELVDQGKIGLRPAVEISYLPEDLQKVLLDAINMEVCMPSHAQAIRMKKQFQEEKLTPDAIYMIMQEEKPNQRERIVLHGNRVNELIPRTVPAAKREDYVVKALEFYGKHRAKTKER